MSDSEQTYLQQQVRYLGE